MLNSQQGKSWLKQQLTTLLTAWLKSNWREKWLNFRFVTFPNWFGRQPEVTLYLALNDPYSYLLIQHIADLESRYCVPFKVKLISENLASDTFAARQWHQWAFKDAQQLAKELNFTPIEKSPEAKSVTTGQQLWQLQPKTVANTLAIFHRVWQDEFEHHYPNSTPVINNLIDNQQQMICRGFFLSASVFYAGRWFWGLDRIALLENLLIKQGYLKKGNQSCHLQLKSCHKQADAITANDNLLRVFLSLRSPYSYLGWQKLKPLLKKHHLSCEIHMVLPLMMRGAKLSMNKVKYIYWDTARLCRHDQIPFNRFYDPLGEGIVNAYQLMPYVQQQGKLAEFIDALFECIYVKGENIADLTVLNTILKTLDLDYSAALEYEKTHTWQAMVEQNTQQLTQLNFWGVPCFYYQDVQVWGQDRLYRIIERIEQTTQMDLS